MRKKGQAGALVTIGIVAIMAIIILSVMYTFLNDNALTPNDYAQTETLTTIPATGVLITLDFDNIINSTFTLDNLSNTVPIQNYTLNAETGVLNLTINTSSEFVNGQVRANYTYLPDGYLSSGTNRTLIALIPVLIALAIFVFIAGFGLTNK